MSKGKLRGETCPFCGITYETLRTGLDFGAVRMMLWTGDPKHSEWKYKRRHTVLGLWHQIKQSMWNEHVLQCEMMLEFMQVKDDANEDAAPVGPAFLYAGGDFFEGEIPF